MSNTAWMPTVTMCYSTVTVLLFGGMLLCSNGRVQHYITLYPSATHTHTPKVLPPQCIMEYGSVDSKYSLFWFYNEA